MKDVYEFLNKLMISNNEPLIIAVSYGPDSMFLLETIKNIYSNNKIICAHVNHNHRKESEKEAVLLKKYCLENNITFEFMKISKYKNNNFTEKEAREKRYNFFEKVLNKYSSKYLFTAHHGDDLVETILMKIVRGSTLKGYSGIDLISKRNNYSIIRPLLYLSKNQILNYCKENNISYAVDNSNFSNEYTRNRYRNNILPYLKEENKNTHLKFLEFSKELKLYDKYINKLVNEKYKKIVNNNKIDCLLLKNEDDLIIKKIIEKYLFKIYSENITYVSNKNIDQIVYMLKSKKSNLKINLPLKINIYKSYNKIYFDNYNKYNDYCYCFNEKIKLPNGYIIKKTDKLTNKSNFVTAFNLNDVVLPFYVRTKKPGDKMEILNLNGTKKVKDIFIDEKLEKKERDNYPIVVDYNDTILWIPGIKKSKYDKSKLENYDIILEYFKEENHEK